jgi:hypothetical protein
MWLGRVGVLLVALVLFAAPVGAETAPQVTDDCGDAGSRGEWNGDGLDLEENRPYLDIASARVAGLYGSGGAFEGFTVAVTVCGEVSAADGGYNIGWGYGDRCVSHVSWTLPGRHVPDGEGASGQIQATSTPQAVVTEECYREQETPLDPSHETVYRVVLPEEAAVFEGDTLTFTVPAALLPAEAAPRLAPGTVWENIGAVSMDQGPSGWAGYLDTEGNRGELTIRTDFALGGASYTVGEDATG